MKLEKLSQFAIELGINQIPTPQLMELASLLVRACAQVQHERSCQRHGYDKYEDGQAILEHFDLG